ncbi:hypothetical protein SAY87_015940 [Trapa incisa]|uniref:Uncharacterized protein n=1 Tax=Trapa incisa TaxID=236973 RepID=A0AAN7L936_9MYRT|nr:hypothetical protein SAY87_015940 [Trapa incisa]
MVQSCLCAIKLQYLLEGWAQITWRFVEAMEKRALRHLLWPDNDSNTDTIQSKFEKLSVLPNCCGAIDVTH